jgi:hypothetical protein
MIGHHRNADRRAGVGMKGWVAALDAACAWVNPRLVLVAVVIALLDLVVASQRWTVAHSEAPASVRTVIVTVPAEGCSPALPPELRDMAGHD